MKDFFACFGGGGHNTTPSYLNQSGTPDGGFTSLYKNGSGQYTYIYGFLKPHLTYTRRLKVVLDKGKEDRDNIQLLVMYK